MDESALLALVEASFDRVLPHRVGATTLVYTRAARVDDEGNVFGALQLVVVDDGGEVRDVREQDVLLVPASAATDPARVEAYFEGWARALPVLWERASAASAEWLLPGELLCPIALEFPAAVTADDFAALLTREDGPWRAWRAAVSGEAVALDDATYAAFLAREQPEAPAEAAARRARALDDALGLLPQVAARVREVHGLELPRTLAVFWAFHASLSRAERAAYDEGLELLRPAGILDYFRPGGLALRARDGLDERLHWRYRCDPPELVTVALGGSDAEHFGLFYDDPAKLPAGVAKNYARDSAETWWAGATLLDVLRDALDRVERHGLSSELFADPLRAACQARLLREAIAAFAGAERDARAEDAPRLVMPYEARIQRPGIVSGVGVLAPGAASPRYLDVVRDRPVPFQDPDEVRRFLDEARRALAAGDVAHALALGRDLHWADRDDVRGETLDLLAAAYRAIGREALARIAEVHHAHRDLESVIVLEAPEPADGGAAAS